MRPGSEEVITQRDGSADVEVDELTHDEVTALLDREAHRLLNISGEEFKRRWNNGDYVNDTDPHVTQVAMLLPDAW